MGFLFFTYKSKENVCVFVELEQLTNRRRQKEEEKTENPSQSVLQRNDNQQVRVCVCVCVFGSCHSILPPLPPPSVQGGGEETLCSPVVCGSAQEGAATAEGLVHGGVCVEVTPELQRGSGSRHTVTSESEEAERRSHAAQVFITSH